MKYYLLLDDLPSYLMSAKRIKFVGVSGYDPKKLYPNLALGKIPPILKPDKIATCNLPDMLFFIKDGKPFCTIACVKGVEIEDSQDSTISKLCIVTGSHYSKLIDTFFEFEIEGANRNDICRYPVKENITVKI